MFELNSQRGYLLLTGFALALGLFAVGSTPFSELLVGYGRILSAPSILLSDYIAIGNLGAAFLNASLIMGLAIIIPWRLKITLTGPIVAAIFTLAGFALFGKNLFNVWPILIGVALYARYQGEPLGKFVVVGLFATSVSPLVSQLAFGFEWALPFSVPLSYGLGIVAGMLFPPLANHFVRFHQGFNLYNVGFTAGIIGMIFMVVMRSVGLNNPPTLILSSQHNSQLALFFGVYFSAMIVIGVMSSTQLNKGLKSLYAQSGRAVSDFLTTHGYGPTFVNMGLLGLMTLAYVLIIGGDLSGPALGGILTVVGFGAFGKHLKNAVPVLMGVYLFSFINVWEPTTPGVILAALFGTTLAPIAGTYGWPFGILAGFLHMAIVMNVGVLHGGMNLYNNGFAGGFVAAILVPLIDALKKSQPS
jgi:hypothetical protein